MSSHGSRLYQNNWIKYRPQDLKVIQRVWEETTGHEFRPDPRIPLDELVQTEIGKESYSIARDTARPFNLEDLNYVTRTGHILPIKRELRPLILLALARADYQFSVSGNTFYVPPLKVVPK